MSAKPHATYFIYNQACEMEMKLEEGQFIATTMFVLGQIMEIAGNQD